MKRIITLLTLFTLALTACGTSQNASPTQLPEVTQAIATAMSTIGPTSSNAITPADLGTLSAVQLAIGTLKLEGTGQAVTATQAATLVSLWSSLKSIESQAMPQGNPQQGNQQSIVTPGNNIAIQQQVDAQVKQIEAAMTSDQLQAIAKMQITQDSMKTTLQELGITMNGPQQNNRGTQGNGGGPVPSQGTPPVGGMPGGGAGNGALPGQGPGLMATPQASMGQSGGDFIPPELINAVVQYLKQKAG
jgi:hypothetical protein